MTGMFQTMYRDYDLIYLYLREIVAWLMGSNIKISLVNDILLLQFNKVQIEKLLPDIMKFKRGFSTIKRE